MLDLRLHLQLQKLINMTWLLLALSSAVFIGIYEVQKKLALHNNSVLMVLLCTTGISALIFIPPVLLSYSGHISPESFYYIPEITRKEHLQVLIKAAIVLTSWLFSYYSMKYLPITIASPIRATAPVWTLLGALVIYSERLTIEQWIGVLVTFSFFYMFSMAGMREGISFKSNRWIWFAVFGTLFASISALYDKFLIRNVDRMAVQAWFSIYQVVLLAPIVLLIRSTMARRPVFYWRWSIPLIGVFLIVADFLYFYALDFEDALISVVSMLRRGSVIITFLVGALVFKEKNLKWKAIYLAGILVGLTILMLG